MRRFLPRLVFGALSVVLGGCTLAPTLCAPCESVCPSGLSCEAGRCVAPGAECAVPNIQDAGHDATQDGAPGLRPDAELSVDAQRPDAGPLDAGCERPEVHAERLWSAGEGAGPAPVSLAGVAVVRLDERAYVLLHGGNLNNNPAGELWLFDLETHMWREISFPDGGTQFGHALLPVPGTDPLQVWRVGGGMCGTNTRSAGLDAFELSLEDGARRIAAPGADVVGVLNSMCSFGAAPAGEGAVWLHGGVPDGVADGARAHGYLVDAAGGHVSAPASAGVVTETSIFWPAVAHDVRRGESYVFGGTEARSGDPVPRFWRMQAESGAWTALDPHAEGAPLPSFWGAMVWLNRVDRVLAFGGWHPTEAAEVSASVHLFDPTDDTWQMAEPELGPSGRFGHRMVALPDGRSALVFGGTAGSTDAFRPFAEAWRIWVTCGKGL